MNIIIQFRKFYLFSIIYSVFILQFGDSKKTRKAGKRLGKKGTK